MYISVVYIMHALAQVHNVEDGFRCQPFLEVQK